MSNGKLIYICGIDGSGKTTLSKNLSKNLGSNSIFLPLNQSKIFFKELDSICRKYNTNRWAEFSEILEAVYGTFRNGLFF